MNKLPWMKYDPDIISLDVDGMSLEEEGAYSRAVRHIWRVGPLPEERLLKLCGNALEAVILCMDQREGLWSFDWLEQARGSAKAWQEQRSLAGKKSAEKRTTVQRPFNDRSTVVLSPSISSSISSPEKERAEIVWPKWAGPNTLSKWEEFKGYRLTEKKERYKSPVSEQRAVNLLGKWFTTGQQCVDAIDEAMGRGWLFPVDPAKRNGQVSPSTAPVVNANGKPQQLKPWVN